MLYVYLFLLMWYSHKKNIYDRDNQIVKVVQPCLLGGLQEGFQISSVSSEWFSKLQLSSDFHEYHYKCKDDDTLLSKLDIWTQKDSFNWNEMKNYFAEKRILKDHPLPPLILKNKCTQVHMDAAPQISE